MAGARQPRRVDNSTLAACDMLQWALREQGIGCGSSSSPGDRGSEGTPGCTADGHGPGGSPIRHAVSQPVAIPKGWRVVILSLVSRSCGEEVCNVLIFARLSRAVHPSPGFTRTPLLIQLPLARLAGVRVFSFLVSPEVSSENIYHPRKGRGEVESYSLETTALTLRIGRQLLRILHLAQRSVAGANV